MKIYDESHHVSAKFFRCPHGCGWTTHHGPCAEAAFFRQVNESYRKEAWDSLMSELMQKPVQSEKQTNAWHGFKEGYSWHPSTGYSLRVERPREESFQDRRTKRKAQKKARRKQRGK